MKKLALLASMLFVFMGAATAQKSSDSSPENISPSPEQQDVQSKQFDQPVVRIIYKVSGLKSEQECAQILKTLSGLDYILDSQLHLATNKLYITVKEEGYEYSIKDYLLSQRSGIPTSFGLDFEHSVWVFPHK